MKIFKRILLGLGAVAVLLVLSALIFLRMSGAWNVIFPSDTHETVAPELPVGLAEPAVLLFTKTNSFRHVGAIKAGVSLWEKLAEEQDINWKPEGWDALRHCSECGQLIPLSTN